VVSSTSSRLLGESMAPVERDTSAREIRFGLAVVLALCNDTASSPAPLLILIVVRHQMCRCRKPKRDPGRRNGAAP